MDHEMARVERQAFVFYITGVHSLLKRSVIECKIAHKLLWCLPGDVWTKTIAVHYVYMDVKAIDQISSLYKR